MRLPGFCAEYTLYGSTQYYWMEERRPITIGLSMAASKVIRGPATCCYPCGQYPDGSLMACCVPCSWLRSGG